MPIFYRIFAFFTATLMLAAVPATIVSSDNEDVINDIQYSLFEALSSAKIDENSSLSYWMMANTTQELNRLLLSELEKHRTPTTVYDDSMLGVFQYGLDKTGRTYLIETLGTSLKAAKQKYVEDIETSADQWFLNNDDAYNIGLEGLTNTTEQIFDYTDIHAFTNMELEAKINSNRNLEYSLLFVQPLYESDEARHNVFTQGRIGRHEENYQNRTTVNLGVGYRYLTPDETWLYGVNSFYDHEFPYNHSRLSVGFESESSLLRFGNNYYLGLSDWDDSRTYYQERPLSGLDLEIAGRLPTFPELEIGIRGSYWNQFEGEENIQEIAVKGDYRPVPAIAIRGQISDDNIDKVKAELGITFIYKLGVPIESQLQKASSQDLLSVKARRFDAVSRQNIIKVQERQHRDTVATITATTGTNYLAGALASVGMRAMFGDTAIVEDTVGDTASMFLTFGDGAVLEIGDGSTVQFLEGVIKLVSGVMRYTSNGSTRNLSTPGATIVLHGTVVELYHEGGESVARVTSGSITMVVNGKTSVTIPTNSAACYTGADPIECTAGDGAYDDMETAVDDRIPDEAAGGGDAYAPTMVTINANGQSYVMGCSTSGGTNTDANCNTYEMTERTITFGYDFEISKYEVSWDEYQTCIDDGGCTTLPLDDGCGKGLHPVTQLTWNVITSEYIPWLNGKTGLTYRLVTEAEWEYVARAGSTTVYSWGDAVGSDNANCVDCGGAYAGSSCSAPAGAYALNAYGVGNMEGNVWELLQDWRADPYGVQPTDGTAYATSTGVRSARGGAYLWSSTYVRTAQRYSFNPASRSEDFGFRLGRTL